MNSCQEILHGYSPDILARMNYPFFSFSFLLFITRVVDLMVLGI